MAKQDRARTRPSRRAIEKLAGEAKDILEVASSQEQDDFDNMPKDLQDDEVGQRAEEAVEALERAAVCCDDAIAACEEARQG